MFIGPIVALFASAVISFFIARATPRRALIMSVALLLAFSLVLVLQLPGFLVFVYFTPAYVIGCIIGISAGSITKNLSEGRAVWGPPRNPIWHGPIAGAASMMLIGFLLDRLVRGIAPSAYVPYFGWKFLFGAILGLVATLLFNRLQGAARVAAFTIGNAVIWWLYITVSFWFTGANGIEYTPLMLVHSLLAYYSVVGLGMLGLLALMAGSSGRKQFPADAFPVPPSRTSHPQPRAKELRQFGRRS